MSDIKLVVWNMEWMNDIFGPNDKPPAFKPDNDETTHGHGATTIERRQDLANALQELDADAVVIVEGPNRTGELQLFFDTDVPGQWETQVQPSKGQTQNVGIAIRTDTGKFEDPPLKFWDTNNIDAFAPFLADTDGDGLPEQHKFERRPLYIELKPVNGKSFRILGLHLKSKAIFDAYEWSQWWQRADANRRRIMAQVTQMRLEFLDPLLTDDQTKHVPLIVCGDINDGPGMDASEKRLFGSAIERLMGTIWKPELCLGNALFDTLSDKDKANLNFDNIHTTSFRDPIFNYMWHRVWIDHILYSNNQDGGDWVTDAVVHHTMTDGQRIWKKYPHASDHFPISVNVHT